MDKSAIMSMAWRIARDLRTGMSSALRMAWAWSKGLPYAYEIATFEGGSRQAIVGSASSFDGARHAQIAAIRDLHSRKIFHVPGISAISLRLYAPRAIALAEINATASSQSARAA